jgi:hypothetical protein
MRARNRTMAYYFYNTDSESLGEPRPRFRTLIAKKIAATGGHRSFGNQLARLEPGDKLLMYESIRSAKPSLAAMLA